MGNADLLNINSEALTQPAQDTCVEELRKQEVQNGTCDICASKNFLLRFRFYSYRECFAMEKELQYGNSLKIGVGQQIIVLFSFFSAYCNSPCLSIQRGRCVCHCFEVEKESVAVWQKWTYDSDPQRLKALCRLCMLLG